MKYFALILLISVAFPLDTLVTTQWPYITRVSEFKTSTFQGIPCDDTEYRDNNGSPAWKNYGGWLSECDSLNDTYQDSLFAIRSKERARQKAIQDSIDLANVDYDLDLDAMWENTVWEEIQDIQDTQVYETEQITAVAGVRGAEAEDEALHHLYYRRSMKRLSELDLQRALGKLIIKRDELQKVNEAHPELSKINGYINQLKRKLKQV